MYKILLDDNFYHNSLEQSKYLEKLLKSIKKYFDAEIVFFEPFYTEIKKMINLNAKSKIVNRQILSTEKVIKYNLNEVNMHSDVVLEKNRCFDKLFIGKIEYILSKNPTSIVIIPLIYSKKNRELQFKEYDKRIYFIGNFDEEVLSNISIWIKNNTLIHIDNPNVSCKFPAKEICNGYNDWRSEILKPSYSGDKIADFTKIGFEVALRNNYIYDSNLTALNKRKAKPDRNGNRPKRQVFKTRKKDVYLSTDFENGGFEVYDKHAIHLGQYRFNGEFEKEPNSDSHPLYL